MVLNSNPFDQDSAISPQCGKNQHNVNSMKQHTVRNRWKCPANSLPCAEQTSDGAAMPCGHSALFASPKMDNLKDALGVLSRSRQQPVNNKLKSVLPGIQTGGIQLCYFRCREEHDAVKVIHQNKLEHTRCSFDSHLRPLLCELAKVSALSDLRFPGVKLTFTLH